MWLLYSLFMAVWTSIGLLLVKKISKEGSVRVLLFYNFLFTLPFMLILIFIQGGFPSFPPKALELISISSVLDFIAFNLSTLSIQMAPVSLLAPISSFNPIFTTFFAQIILGEIPDPIKWGGVFLIVFGAYILNLKDFKSGFLQPLIGLFKIKAVQLTMLATIIWAITPLFQKQAILLTSPSLPIFPSFLGTLFNCIFFFFFSLSRLKKEKMLIQKFWKLFLILGIGSALAQFAAFNAFQQSNLGYVTAIFKLSTLFTIILGGVFLKEKQIKQKLLAGGTMVLGTLLLAS